MYVEVVSRVLSGHHICASVGVFVCFARSTLRSQMGCAIKFRLLPLSFLRSNSHSVSPTLRRVVSCYVTDDVTFSTSNFLPPTKAANNDASTLVVVCVFWYVVFTPGSVFNHHPLPILFSSPTSPYYDVLSVSDLQVIDHLISLILPVSPLARSLACDVSPLLDRRHQMHK